MRTRARRGPAIRWLVALACVTSIAHADTRRVAIVVGGDDADKVARVLGELGGIAPDDLFLLHDRPLADALPQARARIALHHQQVGQRVVLVVYFAGRADLTPDLGALAATGADLRVAVVDAIRPGVGLQIRLAEQPSEAIVTAVGDASKEIGGSFFTHFFVSGLRGAADASGDGAISFAEAYRYAYVHALEAVGETAIDPPAVKSEVVLTELARPSAAIQLPAGLDRGLVIEVAHDQILAEVAAGARPIVAVPAGRYAIRAWKDGKLRAGRVVVAANETRAVPWSELAPVAAVDPRPKGVAEAAPADVTPPLRVMLDGGATTGVANGLGAMFAARARFAWPWGLDVAIEGASKAGMGFRETSTALLGGMRLETRPGLVRAWAAFEAGLGLVLQSATYRSALVSPVLLGGPVVGAALRVRPDIAIGVEAAARGELLRRDSRTAGIFVPAAWIGALFDL